jgi:ABC-type dipeptide/oligopeptide/nickel transport system permease component
MRLLRYTLRRLIFVVPVLLGAIFVAFLMTRIVPGDPINKVAGPYTSIERKTEMRREAGLLDPFYVQFYHYIGDLIHGQMGTSYQTAQPVTKDLEDRFPASFELVFYGMFVAVVLAIPLGVLSAVKRGTWFDHSARVFAVIGVSAPIFWIAMILLSLFYTKWSVLPGPSGRLPIMLDPPGKITGLYTVDAILHGQWDVFWEAFKALVLPVTTIALVSMAPIARMTRAMMLDALDSDYIRTSRSMGLPARVIIFHHALKNAIIPVLTLIAGVFGFALGGEVLVELIFSWPGLGLYSYNAILGSDFPAIQGFIVLTTAIYIVIYLAVDVMTAILDPRVEY